MRKILFICFALLCFLSLDATVVIFDWGDVLATGHRKITTQFLYKTLELSSKEFKKAEQERKKAELSGQSDVSFWMQYAQRKGVALPQQWKQSYQDAVKNSLGVDPAMFTIIELLKDQHIQVGLLSNIGEHTAQQIRSCGFYDPFDPCLLSCDMGTKKPNPKAFQMLLDALHVPAGEVVFIDNKLANIRAAKKLGIDGIVFHSPKQIRKELKDRKLL